MAKRIKRLYEPPVIEVAVIELEQGIATGSIAPNDDPLEGVQEEWDEEDQGYHFEWDTF